MIDHFMNLKVITSPISSTAQLAWHLIKAGLTSPAMLEKVWRKSHSTVTSAVGSRGATQNPAQTMKGATMEFEEVDDTTTVSFRQEISREQRRLDEEFDRRHRRQPGRCALVEKFPS